MCTVALRLTKRGTFLDTKTYAMIMGIFGVHDVIQNGEIGAL